MAKRLVRAKHKIANARIPYRVPPASALPQRVPGVLAVLYLVFNEGYTASAGDDLIRRDLCDRAVALVQVLAELLPEEPEAKGLLALMLFYQHLADVTGSPVVELNRAVAAAMTDGPGAGLALLQRLEDGGALAGYYLLPAARADFLRRLGRNEEAASAYAEAAALAGTEPERRFLNARLAEVRSQHT